MVMKGDVQIGYKSNENQHFKMKSSIKYIFGKQMAQFPENESKLSKGTYDLLGKYNHAESRTVVMHLWVFSPNTYGGAEPVAPWIKIQAIIVCIFLIS